MNREHLQVDLEPNLSPREAAKIRQAIMMVKGVRKTAWAETSLAKPSIQSPKANYKEILDEYLSELESEDTPAMLEAAWIRNRLPTLDV